MSPKSFSVRIFLQDGHAGGVKVVSKSKWTGRGLVIPRSAFAQERERKELIAAGVYVLVDDQAETGLPFLYVDAADPVCEQLVAHDVQDEEWSSAVIFTCRDDSLNSDHFRYIASRLQQLASDHGKGDAINADIPIQTELTPVEKSAADAFLGHMLSLYPLLGVTSFEE